MATIFAATTLDLTREQRKELSDALIEDLGTMYKHALAFHLTQVPRENCRGDSPRPDDVFSFACRPTSTSTRSARPSSFCTTPWFA